jgi:hypothetical protein
MACHASCWIAMVRVSTVSSIAAVACKGIVKSSRSSNVSRKISQSLWFVYKDDFRDMPRM